MLDVPYPPHRYCYLLNPWLVWSIGVADMVIFLSYIIIGLLLLRVASRWLAFGWMLACFGTFIFCCGLGHGIDVVTMWWGVYALTAIIRVTTALASVGTCIACLLVHRRMLQLEHSA